MSSQAPRKSAMLIGICAVLLLIISYPLSQGPIEYLFYRDVISFESYIWIQDTLYYPWSKFIGMTCPSCNSPLAVADYEYRIWWAELAR